MLPELTITSLSVSPLPVTHGTTFTVIVATNADPEDFDDGVAYKLLLYVTSLRTSNPIAIKPPNPIAGHVQDSPWLLPTNIFKFSVNAANPVYPDTYVITATLLKGPTGAGGTSDMSIIVPVV